MKIKISRNLAWKQKFVRALLTLSLALGGTTVALAQVDSFSIPVWTTIGSLNQMSLNQTLFGENYIPDEDDSRPSKPRASKTSTPAKAVSTTIELAKTPTAAARLATAYPEAQRPKAQAMFKQMLGTYGQLATTLGVKENDVAGSVAAFVAGSWMAYHDKDVADKDFPVLVDQMRGVLSATPGFAKATLQQKQELHESFAILGTLMAATRVALQQQPNAATQSALKAAAGSYLEGFLGVDPDDLVIDSKGLHRV